LHKWGRTLPVICHINIPLLPVQRLQDKKFLVLLSSVPCSVVEMKVLFRSVAGQKIFYVTIILIYVLYFSVCLQSF
jgi:hypothetical protein